MSDQELHLRKLIEQSERENVALKASIERHQITNDRLVLENAALRKDSKRLLWLESKATDLRLYTLQNGGIWIRSDLEGNYCDAYGRNIRAAIDSAIEEASA